MNRLKFLKISGAGISGLSLPSLGKLGKPFQSIHSFPQMVGEVSQTSAILQTRLSRQNTMDYDSFNSSVSFDSHDILGISGVARFEIAENSSFDGARKTPWQTAKPGQDFIVKYKIQKLNPATRHYIRVRFGPSKGQTSTGPVNQFTTLSSKDAEDSISFVVSSCMTFGGFFLGYTNRPNSPWRGPTQNEEDLRLGYPALEAIDDLQPAFWVQTGDNVYYDDAPATAKTKEELRVKWHRQMSFPRMNNLLQHVPCYFMKDDHDFRYNDSDARKNGERPSPELAIATFREQVPVVDPKEQEAVTYRTRQINRLLQIWMPEGRDYRDPNSSPDGPQKSIWGKKQFQWLKETLLSSEAVFKLLIVPSPLIGPDDAYKHDNHANYGGFQHERDHFFKWLKEHDFLDKNFYIITGDRHWQYHSIHPSGFEEFGTGTLTTQNSRHGKKPGDPDSTDPLGLISQPYIQEEPTAGFIHVKVKPPKNDRPALLIFETTDKKGNILNSETKKAT